MYNEEDTSRKAIKPSPVSLAVGLIDNLENITSLEFKQEGDSIVMIGNTAQETGGSEYFSVIFGLEGGVPPVIDFEAEKNAAYVVHESIKRKLVNAAHDLSSGGLAISIAEMCIKGNLGAEITLEAVPSKVKQMDADDLLFSESYGRYVLTTKDPQKILKIAEEKGVKASIIGRVMAERRLTAFDSSERKQKIIDLAITSMRDEFENSIERKMR